LRVSSFDAASATGRDRMFWYCCVLYETPKP